MGHRAEQLAARIEQGAAALASFVENLSDAEWKTPVGTGHGDRRPVGVVVHHVASVYPIEMELVHAIAGGHAVTEVTWEVVAQLNGKHAEEHLQASRVATLELLRRNSREAAEATRALSDEQLDSAAPFSLSYGAPMTAQFVLEDHPVRHSWHHLARIRATLGR